jgi:transcriptional regulator with XRE-family HTH domain
VTILTETQSFAARLRQSLENSGVRTSPTVVANEFNLRYWGRSITPHTARNWLLGKAIPTQDKLRVLAEWLQVSPDELRFGPSSSTHEVSERPVSDQALNMVDNTAQSGHARQSPLACRQNAQRPAKGADQAWPQARH